MVYGRDRDTHKISMCYAVLCSENKPRVLKSNK